MTPLPKIPPFWYRHRSKGVSPTSATETGTILAMFISILPFLHSRSFTFVEKTSEDADWARNWSSAFYLDVKTSSYIHQTEFYACKNKIISDLQS